MVISWINFGRAYRRTTNPTSRRRMVYLITGSAAPALGSFPFLLFDSGFASLHPLFFWLTAFLSNLLVGVLLVVMAYAVAFFGVAWTDRVVKARLFKWLIRGPITASITLGLVTLVRRTGEAFGVSYSAFVPIIMVGHDPAVRAYHHPVCTTGRAVPFRRRRPDGTWFAARTGGTAADHQ